MTKGKLSNIFCIIVGVVFLVSGIGKTIDSKQFANLISDYGFSWFISAAPLIIIAEVFLGLCLILNFHRKLLSYATLSALIIFSVVYIYASTVKGISDCGCFGSIKILNLPPIAAYIRNFVLIGLLVFSIIYLPKETKNIFSLSWQQCIFLIVLLISVFFTGYTFYGHKKGKTPKHPLIDKAIKETPLPEYYNFSNDSTYIICVFSYHCSNCWNYMENLNRYKECSEINRVIAFSAGEDENNEFKQFFNPNFEIKSINEKEMSKFIKISPTVLYIQKDTIRHVIQGIVPSIYRFEKDYLND